MIRKWWRRRRALWQLEAEWDRAYRDWMMARDECQDLAVIYQGQPGAWDRLGPAQERVTDLMTHYRQLSLKLERARRLS